MILIGLQNVEKKYEKTRHNAGSILLKYLIDQEGAEINLDKYTNSYKANCSFGTVYLPNTFMNLSGESVIKIFRNFSFGNSPERVYVFVDDVTIPVGGIKVSVGEGASSHNGVKSVVEAFEKIGMTKNDFTRVRIGVGKILPDGKIYEPGPEKLADFVLGNLNSVEISQIQSLGDKIIKSL